MSTKNNVCFAERADVIHVSGLTKIYPVYPRPIDRIIELIGGKKRHSDYVALQDVSFSIPVGGTLGIVGDNGAGKSTLLQLVAGTLTPTSGEIVRRGEVLGLLELGIGFHGQFSGRENIFFYADTLGIPRKLIAAKFDEIVAFSELGPFIDRSLHTYSTGMQMRLAFSLIASLDPDVLIIDEALSVGDIHFQKKCIDRIMRFKEMGKTIIFCTHSTYQISMFCDQVLWLKNGRVEMLDTPERVIPLYEAYQMAKDRPEPGVAGCDHSLPHITAFSLVAPAPLRTGDAMSFMVEVQSGSATIPYHLTLSIKLESGLGVFVTGSHFSGSGPFSGQKRIFTIRFPEVPLMGGVYTAHARVFDDRGLMIYHEQVMPPFEVLKETAEMGICRLENHWAVE